MRSTSEEPNAARTPRVLLRSVEAVEQDVARGHLLHEFLPDITGFYRGWLGREVPR
jgi:acetone carboxylase gamma subunit